MTYNTIHVKIPRDDALRFDLIKTYKYTTNQELLYSFTVEGLELEGYMKENTVFTALSTEGKITTMRAEGISQVKDGSCLQLCVAAQFVKEAADEYRASKQKINSNAISSIGAQAFQEFTRN